MTKNEAWAEMVELWGDADSLSAFMNAKQPGLNFQRPREMFDTEDGRAAVVRFVGQVAYGVYI